MKKSVEQLLKKMNEDKEFAENILKQSKLEKVIETAAAEGIDLTAEDIDEANEIIQKVIKLKEAHQEGELTEEELEKVAGGTVLESAAVGITFLVIGSLFSAMLTAGVSASVIASITVAVSAAND